MFPAPTAQRWSNPKFLRHVSSVNQMVMPYGGEILDFAIEDI